MVHRKLPNRPIEWGEYKRLYMTPEERRRLAAGASQRNAEYKATVARVRSLRKTKGILVFAGTFTGAGKRRAINLPDLGFAEKHCEKWLAMHLLKDWLWEKIGDDCTPIFEKWLSEKQFEIALPPTPSVTAMLIRVVRDKFAK